MAALDFPTSPNDGDTYSGYVYDATAGVWNRAEANLDDLGDVVISAPVADNEILSYDSSSSDWINQTASEAGLATTSAVSSTYVSKTNGTVTTANTSSGVVRNIYTSTSAPSGGIDGDIWIVYS